MYVSEGGVVVAILQKIDSIVSDMRSYDVKQMNPTDNKLFACVWSHGKGGECKVEKTTPNKTGRTRCGGWEVTDITQYLNFDCITPHPGTPDDDHELPERDYRDYMMHSTMGGAISRSPQNESAPWS